MDNPSPLMGAIVGDVIGSIYEHRPVKTKNIELFDGHATYTDDTVLTVCVAKWLMEDHAHSAEKLVLIIKDTCRKHLDAGYGFNFLKWLVCKQLPYNSFGNGSAMRVSPIGYWSKTLDEALILAEISANITHNHPEGVKGAKSVAAAIYMAYIGKTKKDIKNYIESQFSYDLNRNIDKIRDEYSFEVSCQKSVPESIICFLESRSYEDAIKNAISMGGDADTMAAIAGSIAFAFYKNIPSQLYDFAWSKLPNEFKDVIEKFDEYIFMGNS